MEIIFDMFNWFLLQILETNVDIGYNKVQYDSPES